ncbi:phage integrase central domain-containing protein [Ferrovum sp.]|uniref:tyrosine-type recombinase/integrase n=1 Tax=Ferrovum sp. TaxID=2609467 RepID=UPI002637942B|nr:integrase arm-type DNA-binding domain-containing protein [Ferrovum sp.]
MGVTTVAAKLNLLTDTQCRNAACTEGLRIRKLSDGGGLYLWVYADGKKYWRLRYWIDNKEKSISLGSYPEISLKVARSKRDDEREHLDRHQDPAAQRRVEKIQSQLKLEGTFEFVAREWYEKRKHTWVAHHAQDVLRRLEVNLFPLLGTRPINEVEAPELLASARTIEKRGAFDLAHRMIQVSGQVFRYGIATGRCKRDISADLRGALTPHVKKHQAAIKPEELPDLMRAIHSYDKTTGEKKTRLALELLALTFVRTNELIGAIWKEFDFNKKLWIIPAERMKMRTEHFVPLSRQAIVVLEELKKDNRGSELVFPGLNPWRSISNNTMLFALYRMGYKSRMTGHGFRAVASTALNEMGLRSDVIERQLAHGERNKVRAAYNRAEYLQERIKLMQTWADYLDSIVK